MPFFGKMVHPNVGQARPDNVIYTAQYNKLKQKNAHPNYIIARSFENSIIKYL